jgi:hypothetical protein
LSGAHLEPDSPQAMKGLKRRASDVGVVIPNEAAAQRRPVCQEDRKKDGRESC